MNDWVEINYFLFFRSLSLSPAVNDGRQAIPQYRSLSSAFVTIFRQEGVRGLYKGVTPNVWGSGSAWGFYFLLLVARTFKAKRTF